MVDIVTPERRSEIMRRIKGKDTTPEMKVRRFVYGLGYRYRLHCRDLPGKPDLVFRRKQKVIFVNGCFWHQHEGCQLAYMPKSRTEFWKGKFDKNKERDKKNLADLKEMGWDVLVIWECELDDFDVLAGRVVDFLASNGQERPQG